jgi:dienelactone hydrolase
MMLKTVRRGLLVTAAALLASSSVAPVAHPASPSARPDEAVAAREADSPPREPGAVTLPTHSGPLKAFFRPPAQGAHGRAVLLVAANGRTVGSLDPLGLPLNEKGYSVLQVQNPAMIRPAVSPGAAPILDPVRFTPARFASMTRDLQAAVRFLDGLAEVDPSSIAGVGVGLGANLIAMLAAQEPRLSSAVFIRPGWHCDAALTRRSLAGCERMPSLLIAGPGDDQFRKVFDGLGAAQFRVLEHEAGSSGGSEASGTGVPHLEELLVWVAEQLPPPGSPRSPGSPEPPESR